MQIPHDFPFDPRYGYDLDSLLAVPVPGDVPADLLEFWQQTYREAMAVAPRPTLTQIDPIEDGYDLFEIDLDAWGGRRIGGWFMRPREAEPRLGVVMGHGYGGRSEPMKLPPFGVPTAAIQICMRGFHRSAFPDIPDTGHAHVLKGIESRDTYVHRGCIADLWASASALLELVPEIRDALTYWGGSFGGGMGASAVAFDDRFARAFLDIPSFGNYPIRVKVPCTGSGKSVTEYFQVHPEVVEMLRYYDTAIHAQHIQCPTMVAAALFDPAVPPPGQFSVYNGLRCERELFVRQYAHFELPEPLASNDPGPAAAAWLAKAARPQG